MSSFDELCNVCRHEGQRHLSLMSHEQSCQDTFEESKKTTTEIWEIWHKEYTSEQLLWFGTKNQNFSRMENKARTLRFLD